jgi:hypothetical protein
LRHPTISRGAGISTVVDVVAESSGSSVVVVVESGVGVSTLGAAGGNANPGLVATAAPGEDATADELFAGDARAVDVADET